MSEVKKILIVEDSNIIRLEVKRTLERFDVEVLELDNAEDLFRYPKRYQKVNLLILDITLPGMDGLTALEKIHAEREWSYLSVIMLTGRADRLTVQRALKAGAVNYIRKPFTKEQLLERVEQVLGPLVFRENGEDDLLLENQVYNEVKRAERGKYPVSLLEIYIPDEIRSFSQSEQLIKLQKKAKGQLREIDTIYITKKHNFLIILPFTDVKGVTVVAEKIRKWFTQQNIEKIELAKVTFPDDGIDGSEVLHNLKEY